MTKITERMVEKCRRRFEDEGDRTALLDAIDFCARSAMVMPVWLAEAYCAGYVAWATYEARSLDQAFDVERKGWKLSQLRERESMKAAVVIEVDRLRQEGVPVGEDLFERAGDKLGIPMGTARSFYYIDNSWRHLNVSLQNVPLPDWLKAAVMAEVDKLRQEKVAEELLFAQVGEKVNLSVEQFRNLVSNKDDDQVPS